MNEMESKMAKVAEILGVELGEEFELVGRSQKFKLLISGAYYLDCKADWILLDSILTDLICGKEKIKGKSWKPIKRQAYFYPCFKCGKKYEKEYWDGVGFDKLVYENGFLCRTEKEAEALHDFIVAQVKKHRGIE